MKYLCNVDIAYSLIILKWLNAYYLYNLGVLMKNLILSLISIVVFSCSAYSFNVGQFDTTYTFNGEGRAISFYIPTTYQSDLKYNVLIGLHGAGDTCSNYRNDLINTLKWDTLFKNTILIFPDGGSDRSKDFYSPAGDEAFIDTVLNYAKNNFNIDDKNITLQGFSLGGRSALKYGLEYPEKFNGLILNSPAMQCPQDVQNKSGFSLIYNYENSANIPITITHGTNDIGFLKTIKMLADTLVNRNTRMLYFRIPNMQHTIPPNQLTSTLLKYLTTKIEKSSFMLHDISAPICVYSKKIEPKFKVRNMTTVPITSLELTYTVNNQTNTFNWTGEIKENCYQDIATPELELEDGYYELSGYISKINGTSVSENIVTNLGSCSFNIFNESNPIPQKDDFSETDNLAKYWAIKESGNYLTWMYDNTYGRDGNGAMLMLNTILAYTNLGLTESLLTAKYNFTDAIEPKLGFELAYNYSYYTTEYFTEETIFTDTLNVLISNDLGATYTSIYKKWGADLATFASPFKNPLQIETFLATPANNEWRTEIIDLKDYNVGANTIFRFDYISGSGGIIYLDKFNVFDAAVTSVKDKEKFSLSVYPNPAKSNDLLSFQLPKSISGDVNIELFDELGQSLGLVYSSEDISSDYNVKIKLPQLVAGMYMVKVRHGLDINSVKLIIE